MRETAQNSWDARTGSQSVTFALHLRTLSERERQVLADRIFTGQATGLGLREALASSSVRVLEISDRGTKGLGGPIRNDLEIPEGMPSNFIDLIMNIGAPREVHLSGGTYGFGKTITYRCSRVGTVLFWSRSMEGDEVEDRLIGSAFGDNFNANGKRHTGRHWWGTVCEDGARVEPWTGNDARAMAEGVFDASFTDHETGTSLMIINPDLGGETSGEASSVCVRAFCGIYGPSYSPRPAVHSPCPSKCCTRVSR
ncbi:hypothetical protein BJF86_09565 [Serinicoccus sp. CNJ-927]|nr:hypothetical protein BJF86_09565 [Serinicoccus sp. CNJ-927]